MKILFFGTPQFSQIVFQGLIKAGHDVVGVVCRADKPSGRGKDVSVGALASMAKEKNIPIYQYEKLKEHIEDFKAIDADIFVTASYGKILPKELLELKMCVNVHPSLLPKYRGATPIQNALLNGDKVTGVSIMKTEVGMDDGDVFLQEECEILQEDDYNSLLVKLADLGVELLLRVLDDISKGKAKRTVQEHAKATFVKPIEKEDALLVFSHDAEKLVNMVRAYAGGPVAFFNLGEDRIRVLKAKVATDIQADAEIGEIIPNKKRFLIKAANGIFEVLRCQNSGGRVLDARDFLNGYRFKTMVVNV